MFLFNPILKRRVNMDRFDLLLNLLKASLGKNGNKELTILHLINMMEMVNKRSDEFDDYLFKNCIDAIRDI
jgi:hypothetical protein